MKKRDFAQRFLSGMAALILLFSATLISPPAARAADSGESKAVRVAVDNAKSFITTDADGMPVSGYAYEYIQTIAAYADWEVEYLPCRSFSECLELVRTGEADLFYDVSYTEERAEWLLFPDVPMGEEDYYLFCLDNNTDFHYDGPESLEGLSIGVTNGTIEHEELSRWCEKRGISVNILDFESDPAKEASFESGMIDIECEIGMEANSGYSALAKIASADFYLVVTPSRSELLRDINTAYGKIENVNRYFLEHLNEKYFARAVISRALSSDELSWVEGHGTLRVGCLDDHMPFSDLLSSGESDGIVKDTVPLMLENLGLQDSFEIQYSAYKNSEDLYSALSRGEVDVVFPVLDNTEFGADHNLLISSEVISLSADLVYLGSYTVETTKTIAVNSCNQLQEFYTRLVFPHAELKYYNSVEECLQAVARGKAGSTVLNGLRSSALLSGREFRDLVSLRLSQPIDFSFAVARGNSALLSILNRSIVSLGSDFAFNFAFDYANGEELSGFAAFMQKHKVLIMMIAIVVLLVNLCAAVIVVITLKRNQKKLADANAAKTRFLFNMSHDIRTPMNAILGFTDIGLKNLGDDEMVEDCLNKTRQSSNLLLSLINSVLEMSRIESGKAEADEQPGKVDYCFESIRSTMMELSGEKDIYLSFDFGEITDHYVYADFDRVNRIFVNIISNAVQYTNAGGRIKVKCEQISRDGDHGSYRFTFEDNGIGMSEDFQRSIFEEFSRENSTTVSGVQGFGLGLSVVKTFVDLMKGTIECRSKLNVGTTFIVTLPFRLQTDLENASYVEPHTKKVIAVRDEGLEREETELLGKRVLVVEDNELNREIAFYILSEEGLVVEEANDGTKAVELLKKNGCRYYDAILMDIQMPIMDGYEATKAIRALYPEIRIPIIALSANAFAEDKAASLAAGMDGHIAKPIDVKELFSLLGELM